MQYTIESRELTSEYTHRPSFDGESQHVLVEAKDDEEAISRYVADSEAELVSLYRPTRGTESIATIKKADAVFLVRVYPG